MLGLESSVKWRGTDKVRATSLALPPVYARCLPENALPQVASRGHSDRPARPKLGVRPAAPEPMANSGPAPSPARPWRNTVGGVARAAPALSRCGPPPVTSRPARGERARSPGQPARPGGQRTPRSTARRQPDVRAGNRGRGRGGCRALGSRRTQAVPGRPHRQGVRWPRGSGLAVPACLVGWSEPGNQARGGEPS
jgi:hypothetical protein